MTPRFGGFAAVHFDEFCLLVKLDFIFATTGLTTVTRDEQIVDLAFTSALHLAAGSHLDALVLTDIAQGLPVVNILHGPPFPVIAVAKRFDFQLVVGTVTLHGKVLVGARVLDVVLRVTVVGDVAR